MLLDFIFGNSCSDYEMCDDLFEFVIGRSSLPDYWNFAEPNGGSF